MIEVLINFKRNLISTYRKITKFTESSTQTKQSINMSSDTGRQLKMFHQELTKQNEAHIVPFIVAICFAIFAYIGYDYVTLPLLWPYLLILRLFAILCGIISIVLFLRKTISALTAWAFFFISNALTLGYLVTLYDDPIHFMAGNVNLSVAMFILPLALLTYPLNFSISMTMIFIVNYLFWNLLNSSFSLSETLVHGGAFIIFTVLVSILGHWSKISSIKKLTELNLIIETKNQEILEQNRKLELLATYDALTGAYNRGFGLQLLEDRIRQHHRDKLELTIVYIDVDNLKTTNDRLGHKYGDQLIVGVVESMRSGIRQGDLVCRMGGDEFLLVMSNCSLAGANEMMKRICGQLDVLSSTSQFPYEISWGALSCDRDNFASVDEFIERADRMMYESKQEKKNKQHH